MAGKIPTYAAQVKHAGIPDLGRPAYLDVQGFAKGSNAAILARAGHDLAGMGNMLGAYAVKRKEQEVATDLLADKVAYEDALRSFESDYKKTMQGKDARTAEDDYNRFHQEQISKLQEKWQGNPFALRGVDSMAESLRTSSMNRAVAYRDQQEEANKANVLKAARMQAIQTFADPTASYAEKLKVLEQEEMHLRYFAGQRLVQGPDGSKQWTGGNDVQADILQLRQAFHIEHVESLIATNRLGEARKYTREHAREFGAKANNITMMIDQKVETAERRAEVAAQKRDRLGAKQQADAAYGGLRSTLQGLSLEEQKVKAVEIISTIEDSEVRKKMTERLSQDMALETMQRNANDMMVKKQLLADMQKHGWSAQRAMLEVERYDFSDMGIEKMTKELESKVNKVTHENLRRRNEMLVRIDRKEVTSEPEIEAFAFEHGLTTGQVSQAVKYLNEGGNAAGATFSKVEGIYKRMGGKGKKMPEGFYDLVLENLEPGKVPTDEHIKKVIANLYMDGHSGKSDLRISWDYDGFRLRGERKRSENYADALKEGRGKEWMPEVSDTERKEITSKLKGRGYTVTDERVLYYKKHSPEYMGVPE